MMCWGGRGEFRNMNSEWRMGGGVVLLCGFACAAGFDEGDDAEGEVVEEGDAHDGLHDGCGRAGNVGAE